MEKIAVLFSGGVESSSLLGKYLNEGFEVYPLYVEGGFKYEASEKAWAQSLWEHFNKTYPGQLKEIETLNIAWDYGRDDSIPLTKQQLVIPLRNMVLFSLAAIYMKRNGIHILGSGIMGDENFPDTSRDYLGRLQSLISEGAEFDFEFRMDFYSYSKADVIKECSSFVPYEMTRSCTTMLNDKHCGICSKCKARKQAFLEAGISDPTQYAKQEAA